MKVPYNWQIEKHQLSVIDNPARFKVLVWHRKAHKTTLAINELIRWAASYKGIYWYVAPFYGQAKETVWQDPSMLARYCPSSVWGSRNNSELYLKFPIGSFLFIKGADNPESLRGPNPQGVVLDEFDDMKSEVWSAIIQPIMAANPTAWCWLVGTVKSKKKLWQKYMYATTSGDSSWWGSLLPASKSGIIPLEQLEEAKRTMPKVFYESELECNPIEGANAIFRRVRENIYQGTLEYDELHQYKLGVDLAKAQDFTVITPFDLNTFKALAQDRFNQLDWPLQKARISSTYYKFNKPKITLDSTGLGDPIYDDLVYSGLNVDSFKFNDTSRQALLLNLALRFEQDEIKIPNDEGLINELESMIYDITNDGKRKMVTIEGHDDRVMSLALAIWGATKVYPIEERQEIIDPFELIPKI